MQVSKIAFQSGLADLEKADWFVQLERLGERLGYYEPLGRRHAAAFVDGGPQLLVTFESYQQIEKGSETSEPRGFDFVRRLGWSQLALIGDGETWFRDATVYRYFDRLIDDGFFEDFERVLFFGAHAGAYAACAFSVTAPGARVLALRPQATLDPAIAGWDTRYIDFRRLCFTDRYGYAPDMIEAAVEAWIAFDPLQPLDAMHAALFRRSHVAMLPCRNLGWRLDHAFDAMDISAPLIEAAMSGTLTQMSFARLLRNRRDYLPYLRQLYQRLDDEDHAELAATLCRHALKERVRPFFARKLAELEAAGVAPRATEPAD